MARLQLKTFYLGLIFCFLIGSAYGQHGVNIYPEKPKPGDSVRISLTAPHFENPPVFSFTYSNFYTFPTTMNMHWAGNEWQTTFRLPPYAILATFVIKIADSILKPSEKQHYALKVYNDSGELVENGYMYYGFSLGVQEGKSPVLKAHQSELYKKELEHHPENYQARLQWLNWQISQAPAAGKSALLQEAKDIIAQKFYSDPGRMAVTNLTTMGYLIIGEKTRVDSIWTVIKEKYPESEAGYELRISDLTKLKDTATMIEALEAILIKENGDNFKYLTSAHEALFNIYTTKHHAAKALHHLSYLDREFTPYTPQNLKARAELLYINGVAPDTAFSLAKKALAYADTFPISLIRYFPETGYLPSYVSPQQRAQSVKEVTGQLKSLMALIYQKQGREQESKTLMSQATEISGDHETLRNAALFYSTNKNHEKAFDNYRKIALSNPEDSMSFEAMKNNYIQWKGSDAGLGNYISDIRKTWDAMTDREIQKDLMSEPLPDVVSQYVDMKGRPVDAALLRDKVVIMDFWATWCVPCMKAMPYMHAAYLRYINDPDVVFMIVNSGAQNELSDAQNWWGHKAYGFPVYYNKDRTIGEKLGFSVIPATYVIDRKGNIRFKTIGFEGESLTRTLIAKIEMLKSESGD